MNSKKVVVILLFVVTIVIGLVATYFATVLKTPTVTPTPTPTKMATKTPTVTPTSTSDITNLSCGQPCDKNTCMEGLSCLSIGNTSQCVLNSCVSLQNGIYLPNGSCQADLCASLSTTPVLTTSLLATKTPVTTVSTIPSNLSCGQTCSTGTCANGLNCITLNGVKKCVSNSCVSLQNGSYVSNGTCTSDLCTMTNSIAIIKTSGISCVSGKDQRKISFNIKITNPVGNTSARTNVSVFDVLNTNLLPSYIDTASISHNGQLVNGQIQWQNLSLDANGGALELHYDVIVPSTENGKSYSNTVSVLEGGVQKNQYSFEYSVNILPCTALINDEVDRVLFGVIILIFGLFMYKMNWHYTIGQNFWRYGGKNIYKFTNNIFLNITQRGNKKFERKIIQEEIIKEKE